MKTLKCTYNSGLVSQKLWFFMLISSYAWLGHISYHSTSYMDIIPPKQALPKCILIWQKKSNNIYFAYVKISPALASSLITNGSNEDEWLWKAKWWGLVHLFNCMNKNIIPRMQWGSKYKLHTAVKVRFFSFYFIVFYMNSKRLLGSFW